MINTQTGIKTFTSSNYTTTGNLSAATAAVTTLNAVNSNNTNLTIQKRSDVVHPVDTPLYRKFTTLATGSGYVLQLANLNNLVVGMAVTGTGIAANSTISAISTLGDNRITINNVATNISTGQIVTFYSSTLGVLALDYATLQGMTLTITPYTISSVPVWYTGLSFVNIPTDNTCVYEFNFIIYAPYNTKTLSFSNATMSINGNSYPVNGYNNLIIGPTTITYILQTIKMISGLTSANQTYTILTTIQGL